MNLRCVAESAAVVAWHGVDGLGEFSSHQQASLTEYWKTTRFLCRRWERQLRSGEHSSNGHGLLNQLAEEIIVSEILTRCLGSSLFVLGEITNQPEFAQIARRTLADHRSLRVRVVSKLEESARMISSSLRIERLLRKTKRWTDLFVSRHSESDVALEAAFDCERCLEFADDWHMQATAGTSAVTLQLQLSALVLAIPNQEISDTVNAQAHENRSRIALSFLNTSSSMKQVMSTPRVHRMILSSSDTDSRPSSGFKQSSES